MHKLNIFYASAQYQSPSDEMVYRALSHIKAPNFRSRSGIVFIYLFQRMAGRRGILFLLKNTAEVREMTVILLRAEIKILSNNCMCKNQVSEIF